MAFDAKALLPLPSQAELRKAFVGKKLEDVPTPAAVLDKAVVRRNCLQMLSACGALQVGLRPHVKTHKVYLRAFLSLYPVSIIEEQTFFDPCAVCGRAKWRLLIASSTSTKSMWLSKFLQFISQMQLPRSARKLELRSQSSDKSAVFTLVLKAYVVVDYETVQRDRLLEKRAV